MKIRFLLNMNTSLVSHDLDHDYIYKYCKKYSFFGLHSFTLQLFKKNETIPLFNRK